MPSPRWRSTSSSCLADADPEELRELLVEAWLELAPKRLAAEHEDRLLGG